MKKLIENINDMRKSLNEISVYDLNTYTAIELYYALATKTNEVITELSRFEGVISDEIIEQNEKLTYLLGEGLNIEVVKKINQMIADGTMDSIINTNIFNDLNSKVDTNIADITSINNKLDVINNNIKIILPTMTIAEINEKLDSGGTFIFKKGEYRVDVDNQITPASNSHLIFEAGSTIVQTSLDQTNYEMINLYNVDNVIIENPVIIGERDKHVGNSGEWGHGISILSCNNIKILNPIIRKTWGDGIYIGYKYYIENPRYNANKDILIQNATITDCSRNGISICSSLDVKVINAFISGINRTAPTAGIDIEPEHDTNEGIQCGKIFLDNIVVRDCNLGLCFALNEFSNYEGGDIKIGSYDIDNCPQGAHINNFSNNCKCKIDIENLKATNVDYQGLLLKNISKNIDLRINDFVMSRKRKHDSDDGEFGSGILLVTDIDIDKSKIVIDKIRILDSQDNYGHYIYSSGTTYQQLEIGDFIAESMNNNKRPIDCRRIHPIEIKGKCPIMIMNYETPNKIDRTLFGKIYQYKDLTQVCTLELGELLADGEYNIRMKKVVPHALNIILENATCPYDGGQDFNKISCFESGGTITLRKEGNIWYVVAISGKWEFRKQ